MFPTLRNLDFLIKSYNSHFKKNYSMRELEGQPLSLWQTNIYPLNIYEKLCGWLERLIDEIYPWSNQLPYETHFGSIGGYTERALSIFNAFEIYEGMKFTDLDINHGIETISPEQYDKNSFLNNYSQDIHSVLIHDSEYTDYTLVTNESLKNSIKKENENEITCLYFIDKNGGKSKPLMIIVANNNYNLKTKENFLHCNLDDYEIYFKEVNNNIYNIVLEIKT